MVRKEFIKNKIELIEEDLQKLSAYKYDLFEDIAKDFIKLNVVERLLEKIIMRAIDINEHIFSELSNGSEKRPTYKETFLNLADLKICPREFAEEISKSAGLRNALIHDYDDINIGTVYSSIGDALKQYHKYCKYLLDFISR